MLDARISVCNLDPELKGNEELFKLIASEFSYFFKKNNIESKVTENDNFKTYNLDGELEHDINYLKQAAENLESSPVIQEGLS